MYIKSAQIQNIRCFEDVFLQFQCCRDKDDDRLLNWNVILGNNGDGKSTLLQAIAACLMDINTAQTLWKPDDRAIVRTSKPFGRLQSTLARDDSDKQQGQPSRKNEWQTNYLVLAAGQELEITENSHTTKRFFPKSTILEPSSELKDYFVDYAKLVEDIEYLKRNAFSKHSHNGWVSCGYGPFRRVYGFSSQSAMTSDVLERRFYTLFDEGASLYDCEYWLKELDRKASKESSARKEKNSSQSHTLKKAITLLKKLLPEIDSITVKDEVQFHRNGEKFNLSELSDGYRSMFALAVDLMRWVELLRRDKAEDINLTRGVVLIDEIDAHLHPRWQRQIGFWLTELFPNIQFIVTTHSPFVAMAAGHGALTVLERNQDGSVFANQSIPFVRGWAVDKVLSELMGMDSLRDPETEQLLEKYDDLKFAELQPESYPVEAQKLSELRQDLEKRLKDSDQTLDERDLDQDLKYFASLSKKKGRA